MRRPGILWVILVMVAVGFMAADALSSGGPNIIIVNSTADPHDFGFTTLRDAIIQANGNGYPDIIGFDAAVFPSGGGTTIAVSGLPLPALTDDGDTIDGTYGDEIGTSYVPLDPGSVIIDGSLLGGPDDHGLVLNASGLEVVGLKVTNFPGCGIFVAPGEENPVEFWGISITENIIEGNGQVGIHVLGSLPGGDGGNDLYEMTIAGNEVANHPLQGIRVCTTGGAGSGGGNEIEVDILGNTVTGAGSHGIHLVAGDGEGSNWLYMEISGEEGFEDANECTGAGGDGIRVDGGLNGSTHNHVEMLEMGGSIDWNVSTGNEGAGIGVYGGEGNNTLNLGSISYNDVSGNGEADWGAGIWVSAGGSNNELWISQINSNDASNNGTSLIGGDGIYVDGGDDGASDNNVSVGTINGNTVNDNPVIGITVKGGRNGGTNNTVTVEAIDGNTVTGGDWFGIWVLGGDWGDSMNNSVQVGSISDNNVSDASVVSILVVGGNECLGSNRVSVDTIGSNTVSGSLWDGIQLESWDSDNNEIWVGSIVGNSSTGNLQHGISIRGGADDGDWNETTVEVIADNTLTGNGTGICLFNYASSDYNTVNVGAIVENTITSNGTGIELFGSTNGPWEYLGVSTDNDGPGNNNTVIVQSISANDISGNTDAGISLLGSYDEPPTTGSHSNFVAAVVEGNTITNNDGQGVNLALYNQGLDTTPSSFVYADLGGGDGAIVGGPGSAGGNIITGNGASPVDVENHIPVDVLPFVMALWNTFDNVDPAAIDFYDVFDDDEDPTFGPVVFSEDNVFSDGRLQVVRANARRGRLFVRGWFKPNADGDGADITAEDVRVALFNDEGFAFSDTMPAGEINKKGRGRNYIFTGGAPGITKAKFVRWNGGRWLFTLWAKGIDCSDFSKPVMLQLAVGNDQAEYSLGFIENNNHK